MSRRQGEAGEQAIVTVGFARMFRRTTWSGFCEMLKLTKGLAAIVVESGKEPGRIGHTICLHLDYITPEGREPQEDEELKIPGGKELEKILRWHGTARIYWKPGAGEQAGTIGGKTDHLRARELKTTPSGRTSCSRWEWHPPWESPRVPSSSSHLEPQSRASS